MKKIITLGLTLALLLTAGTMAAFAATSMRGANYVDSDADGVCDNMGTHVNFIDEDGDGICDNIGLYSGRGMGRGKNGGNFVDSDGDGINDNIGSGAGGYFTDANGDGECDNIGSGQGRGRNRN